MRETTKRAEEELRRCKRLLAEANSRADVANRERFALREELRGAREEALEKARNCEIQCGAGESRGENVVQLLSLSVLS